MRPHLEIAVLVYEDIARFKVTMYDTCRVDIFQPALDDETRKVRNNEPN